MRHSTFTGEVEIDYVLTKSTNPSDVLVISFPGIHDTAKPERFTINNMMSIGRFNVNALYISYARKELKRSSLVGFEGDFAIERSVMELVKFACSETGATRCIGVGSSMGGACSLYYGLKYNWDIVAGGAKATIGGLLGKKIAELIPNVKESGFDKSIHLSWGEGEPIWRNPDMAPAMLKRLDKAEIPYSMELLKYSNHGNVHKMFPFVLKQRLSTLLGLETDAANKEDAKPTEVEIAADINASLKGLVAHMTGLEHVKPNPIIRKRRNRGERRADAMIRTFVYAAQGYHWLSQSKPPAYHKPGRFWQTIPSQHDRYAYSLSFQATSLNHFKKTGQIDALKLVAENLAEFFPLTSFLKASDPKGKSYNRWMIARSRGECLIDFACTVHEQSADPGLAGKIEWDLLQAEVAEAVKVCLRTESLLTDAARNYARLHFILLAAVFFKESTEFYREAYERAMAAVVAMIDYQFDEQGVCIFEQVQMQHNVAPYLRQIIDFVEANGFEPNQNLKKAKRRMEAIEAAAAHLTSPDGLMPNIGHTDLVKTSTPPAVGNYIKKSSNIAVLSDGGAYITIGGGSNVHSAYRHCDLLSFTFRYNGQQLVWDAGGGTEGLTDYARSAVAHSALFCDQIDYITPDYDDWTTLKNAVETEDYVAITGQHTLIDGVTLWRKWIWLKPNIIVICDQAQSNSRHVYTQNFLFPNAKVDNGKDGKVTFDVAKGLSLDVTQLPADGDFKLNRYFGTDNAAAKEKDLRGSRVVGFTKCAKLVNLAYEKRAKNAKFLTVLEARSGKDNELTFGSANIENGKLTVTATAGEKTINVSESLRVKIDD